MGYTYIRAYQWISVARVAIKDYRIDSPTVMKRVVFRLHFGSGKDRRECSYRLGLSAEEDGDLLALETSWESGFPAARRATGARSQI
jgi:hypothetical protein